MDEICEYCGASVEEAEECHSDCACPSCIEDARAKADREFDERKALGYA